MDQAITDTNELAKAYETAKGWAEGGYTPESRAYWSGMRDTLAVILGHTTTQPQVTGPGCDAAAVLLLRGCAPLRG